jgi:hypothetical protein
MRLGWFATASGIAMVAESACVANALGVEDPDECPVAIGTPHIADPWVLIGIEEPDERLADRNGDGVVCSSTLLRRARTVTDNTVGDPHIIPPGPCTDPFRPVAIGDPSIFWLRQIDANGDGLLCGAQAGTARALILILLDNPNAVPRG